MRIAIFFLLAPALFCRQTSDFDARLASGKAALQQGRYLQAENALREAVAAADRIQPQDPARLVQALETLSDLDLLVGRYAEAIALEERTVDNHGERARRRQP